jgi:hypothetical protein
LVGGIDAIQRRANLLVEPALAFLFALALGGDDWIEEFRHFFDPFCRRTT